MVAGERPGAAGWGSGQEATEAIARRFFDFFKDVPHGMQGLEALCGQAGGWPGPTILGKSFGSGPPIGRN